MQPHLPFFHETKIVTEELLLRLIINLWDCFQVQGDKIGNVNFDYVENLVAPSAEMTGIEWAKERLKSLFEQTDGGALHY